MFIHRYIRRLYWLRDRNPISDELRGWAWDRPPVRPQGFFGLGVSEVAYRYCEVFRDLWLRRNGGYRPRFRIDSPMGVGLVVHRLMEFAVMDASRFLKSDLSWKRVLPSIMRLADKRVREAGNGVFDKRFYEFYITMLLSFLMQSITSTMMHSGVGFGSSLPLTEYVVDGSRLGLSSRLRIDAVSEFGLIIEYKYGGNNTDRHSIGLAGYALALESELELPIDFGLLIYLKDIGRTPGITVEPIYIDNELRREFLDNRDEAIEVLMQPRPPPPLHNCSPNCPFYEVCHGKNR